jgi:hypothetical protein
MVDNATSMFFAVFVRIIQISATHFRRFSARGAVWRARITRSVITLARCFARFDDARDARRARR